MDWSSETAPKAAEPQAPTAIPVPMVAIPVERAAPKYAKPFPALPDAPLANDVDGMVIGGHGDTTMIPLVSKASYKGVPVSEFLDEKTLGEIAAATMVGGATLTKMLGTSAWYAPGAAAARIVESIINDEKKVFPSCVHLEGQYGQDDLYIGAPAVIGRNGAEKVIEINLNETEKAAFAKSAEAVRNTNKVLYEIGAL